MKKTIVFVFALLLAIPTFAKSNNYNKIPQKIKNTFAKEYPNAKKVNWDLEDGGYEASFVLNKTNMSVIIDKNGEIKETETEIKTSALPKMIVPYFNKHFKGYKITGTAKIVDEEDVMTYEAEVTKGGKYQDLIFNKDGVRILKVKKSKKNEND